MGARRPLAIQLAENLGGAVPLSVVRRKKDWADVVHGRYIWRGSDSEDFRETRPLGSAFRDGVVHLVHSVSATFDHRQRGVLPR